MGTTNAFAYGKVTLRPLQYSDMERCSRWIADAEVVKHVSVVPPPNGKRPAPDEDGGGCDFAILAENGEHIGVVGLHSLRVKERTAELGILIGEKRYWDRGYGADAVMAVLRFAFEAMRLRQVQLRVDVDSPRAIRCYEKCGFVREATLKNSAWRSGGYEDQYLMSISAAKYRRRLGLIQNMP